MTRTILYKFGLRARQLNSRILRVLHEKQRIASVDAAAWWCENSSNLVTTELDCQRYFIDATALDGKNIPHMFQFADPLIVKPQTLITQSNVVVSGDCSSIYYPAYKRVSCDLHSQFSEYLTKYDFLSHDSILKAATPNKLSGQILFLGTSQGSSNFWHWIHEVCARLIRVKKFYDLDYFDKVIVPPIGTNRWALEFLELLGLNRSKIIDSASFFYVDNMTTLNICKMTSSLELGNYFKKILTRKKSTKLFLERSRFSGIHKRNLLNFDRYRNMYSSAGFTFVRPELLQPLEQIQAFLDADAVVGLSGSGFSLCGLMRANQKVVEIFSRRFLDPAIAMNCATSALKYGFFVEAKFRPNANKWEREYNCDIDANEVDHQTIINFTQ